MMTIICWTRFRMVIEKLLERHCCLLLRLHQELSASVGLRQPSRPKSLINPRRKPGRPSLLLSRYLKSFAKVNNERWFGYQVIS